MCIASTSLASSELWHGLLVGTRLWSPRVDGSRVLTKYLDEGAILGRTDVVVAGRGETFGLE